jgi:hypothetical protein
VHRDEGRRLGVSAGGRLRGPFLTVDCRRWQKKFRATVAGHAKDEIVEHYRGAKRVADIAGIAFVDAQFSGKIEFP